MDISAGSLQSGATPLLHNHCATQERLQRFSRKPGHLIVEEKYPKILPHQHAQGIPIEVIAQSGSVCFRWRGAFYGNRRLPVNGSHIPSVVDRKQEVDGFWSCTAHESDVEVCLSQGHVSHSDVERAFYAVGSMEICVDDTPDLPFGGRPPRGCPPHAHASFVLAYSHAQRTWR